MGVDFNIVEKDDQYLLNSYEQTPARNTPTPMANTQAPAQVDIRNKLKIINI